MELKQMTRSEKTRSRLQECRNVHELRDAISELCRDIGNILGVTVLCASNTPGNGMCVIDFPPEANAASRCAAALGGRVFGYHSVILSFPYHTEFACTRGFPPAAPSCSCNS